MAEVKGVIIDEPRDAGTDLAVSQAWLAELEGMNARGASVGEYLERARALVREAEDTPQLLPRSAAPGV